MPFIWDKEVLEKNYINNAYYKKRIDYDNKAISKSIKNCPGLGSYESRFVMKFQINELNGAGKYNLIYPLKKVNEGNRHF